LKQLFTSWVMMVVVLSLLSSCAPTRYPPGHAKQQGDASTPTLGAGGYVKRGKPYQISGKWYHPLASGDSYDEEGVASWYGKKFHGKMTANGETYDMYAMTAAHTTLPMPAFVLVTNLNNGKQVKVRVNDRGPFVKSRLIDLSYSAAKALGYTEQGTARVRVQIIQSSSVKSLPTPTPVASSAPVASLSIVEHKKAYVQVGAFGERANADGVLQELNSSLQSDYPKLHIQDAPGVYRVRMGPFDSDESAASALNDVKGFGYDAAMVIHD
jgi:rare lipoprotein A